MRRIAREDFFRLHLIGVSISRPVHDGEQAHSHRARLILGSILRFTDSSPGSVDWARPHGMIRVFTCRQ